MPKYWEYVGTCLLPTDLPTGVLAEWQATLKGEQARIYASLLAKIPNESAFQDRIADASSDRYEVFLDGVGEDWSRDLVLLKQRVKLARAYTPWDTGIDDAFGEGGYFPDRVDAKADKFKLARYTLGAVGHRATVGGSFGVWNPVTMGVLLMRGDTRCPRYFDDNDDMTNEENLESVFSPTKGRLISPAIIASAVQACVLAKFADEGGLSTERDAVITNANDLIDDLIQVGLNDTHSGVGYDATYVLSWNGTADNIDVTVTDIHPT